jgi:hypothetical protein
LTRFGVPLRGWAAERLPAFPWDLGSHLRSKSDTGQINEALCKVLAHNICVLVQATHELGIEPVYFTPTRPQTADLDIR